MHECVQYTDLSLRLLFKRIKNTDWYNNTLFVITADHTNESFIAKYTTSVGIFRVPIIFFDPSNSTLAEKTTDIIQHIDIMPSILSYIKYNKPFKAFGKDIFNKDNSKFCINHNNDYQLIIDNKVAIYNEASDQITQVYDLKKDSLLRQNILINTNYDSIIKYRNKIQAFIQIYNNSMINNTLRYEN